MSGLLTLAGIATAVAALVFCGNDIGWRYDFIDIGLVCDRSAPATTSEYGWTHGWRQRSDYGDSKWLETECREYMEMLTVRTQTPWPRGRHRPQPRRDGPWGPGAEAVCTSSQVFGSGGFNLSWRHSEPLAGGRFSEAQ